MNTLQVGVVRRRVAEVYMFDTCTHKCGYCWLAESGQVLDAQQLKPFRDSAFIDQIAHFFNSRTTADSTWLLQLTGGEPLLAPNLARLCDQLVDQGNAAAFYTALLVEESHPGFQFLMSHAYPAVDYVMGSFHPEAELDEERHFRKYRLLKDRGHRVFLRYVGHPLRLDRLDHLQERCRELDICFYPTTLFSESYPAAYSTEQKQRLQRSFTSMSQLIQLEGGIDTHTSQCRAGSRNIAVNLQTGNVTPCITVQGPSLGNVFEDRLDLYGAPIACPEPGIACTCEGHFQQDIVIGAHDGARFEQQARGFVDPVSLGAGVQDDWRSELAAAGLTFAQGVQAGIGRVQGEGQLFFGRDEVKARWRARHQAPARSCRVRLTMKRRVVEPGREVFTARVLVESEIEVLSAVELFVNERSDGSASGAWRQIGTVSVESRAAKLKFKIDAAGLGPGRHRVGVNVHFASGLELYWYQLPPEWLEVMNPG